MNIAYDWADVSSEELIKRLSDLPPVTPARPKGKWMRFKSHPDQPEHIKCSCCGQYWSISEQDKIFKYCFNCGADMKEDKK